MSISVQNLGELSYGEAWKEQLRLLDERIQDSIPDTLLTVTHPHVVTLGRGSPEWKELQKKGETQWGEMPLFFAERGGEATYHGPGQIVLYPIFKISLSLGPAGFIRMLEEAVINVLHDFNLAGYRLRGATGVWVRDVNRRSRKIASMGIAVRQQVTYHGLALNVSTDLSYFSKITPCGLPSRIMTSMQDLLPQEVMDEKNVMLRLVDHFLTLYAQSTEDQNMVRELVAEEREAVPYTTAMKEEK